MPTLVRTARTTGLFYLGVAITGTLGFLLIRPRLYAAGDPTATLAHLVAHENLARIGVAVELLLVLTQALTAAWFYRLFREVHPLGALGIAAFGLVNSVLILANAAILGTAVQMAVKPFGDAAATVQFLYVLSGNVVNVAGLFFGLWLIPMGLCVLRSRWMPRPLGWVLTVGGIVGYVLQTLIVYLLPDAHAIAGALPILPTIGELWMIGYLLVRGVRDSTVTPH